MGEGGSAMRSWHPKIIAQRIRDEEFRLSRVASRGDDDAIGCWVYCRYPLRVFEKFLSKPGRWSDE